MKAVFLINGLGLGNSTRCYAIIRHLHVAGVVIEVITSGNGLWYFSDKSEISVLHEIEPLSYGAKDGTISISRTLSSVPGMIRTFRHNLITIASVLDADRPAVVVIDSDYSFLPMRKRKIPIVAINNSDVVAQSYRRFVDRPLSIAAQFFAIEMNDYLFHRVIPDLVLSPSFDGFGGPTTPTFRRIGPIIRDGFNPSTVRSPPERVAVMLSGSTFGTRIKFKQSNFPFHIDVIGREKPVELDENPSVSFHGKLLDTYKILSNADLTVVNGGFSAVSEMFCLRKPMVVVPVPRHAEQWINARTMAHLGVGVVAGEDNYENAMLHAANGIDSFCSAYADLPEPQDGARQAADAIIEIAEAERVTQ